MYSHKAIILNFALKTEQRTLGKPAEWKRKFFQKIQFFSVWDYYALPYLLARGYRDFELKDSIYYLWSLKKLGDGWVEGIPINSASTYLEGIIFTVYRPLASLFWYLLIFWGLTCVVER